MELQLPWLRVFHRQRCGRGVWVTSPGVRAVTSFTQLVALLPQSVISLASCSRRFISLGPCSVKSELSCQTLTVPVASPAAKSRVCLMLNSKQYTGHSPAACFMETAGFCELFPKSNRCTSPTKQKHLLQLYGNGLCI